MSWRDSFYIVKLSPSVVCSVIIHSPRPTPPALRPYRLRAPASLAALRSPPLRAPDYFAHKTATPTLRARRALLLCARIGRASWLRRRGAKSPAASRLSVFSAPPSCVGLRGRTARPPLTRRPRARPHCAAALATFRSFRGCASPFGSSRGRGWSALATAAERPAPRRVWSVLGWAGWRWRVNCHLVKRQL